MKLVYLVFNNIVDWRIIFDANFVVVVRAFHVKLIEMNISVSVVFFFFLNAVLHLQEYKMNESKL